MRHSVETTIKNRITEHGPAGALRQCILRI